MGNVLDSARQAAEAAREKEAEEKEMRELKRGQLKIKFDKEKDQRVTARLEKAIAIQKYKEMFGMTPPREFLEVVMSKFLEDSMTVDFIKFFFYISSKCPVQWLNYGKFMGEKGWGVIQCSFNSDRARFFQRG